MDNLHNYIYETAYTTISGIVLNLINKNPDNDICNIIGTLSHDIINNTVIMVYYSLYELYAPKKSMRSHMQSVNGISVLRDDSEYDCNLNAYINNRKLKQASFEEFFKASDVTLPEFYKKFENEEKGKAVKRTQGHKISELQFIQLSLIRKYRIFDAITKNRLQSSKKISNSEFEEIFFPEICSKNSGIYHDISSYSYTEYPNFMKCLNFFTLELNCTFEKNYLAAKSLMKVSDKEKRQNEIFIFRRSNVFEIGYRQYQDSMISGCKKIFDLYNPGFADAEYIYLILLLQ